MVPFLEILAGPVLKFAIKTAGNSIGLGLPVGDIAFEMWESYRKHRDQKRLHTDIEQVVQDPKAAKDQIEPWLKEHAAGQPEAVIQQVAAYLNMVPAAIQRSLRRPEDPTGTTVPANLAIHSAADLEKFIPDRMPRFKVGDHPLPGSDLVLEQFLGMGGFGEVWKAAHIHRPLAPPVALKFCTDPAAAKSLRKEVELLDRVATHGRHPNIVELKYTHLENEPLCLEYEYVNGGDLAEYVTQLHASNQGTPQAIAGIVARLASAVGYAHTQEPPIVHRDLKPANILVEHTHEGKSRFKIADFGIGGVAAGRDGEDARETARAASTTTVGSAYTPLYASPQQRKGRAASARDDVYALGVIWYQLAINDLTSEAPRGASWKLRLAERGMSGRLIALLEQCVEDRPEDRPENALALANSLNACLQGSTVERAAPVLHASGPRIPVNGDRRFATPVRLTAVPAEPKQPVAAVPDVRAIVAGPARALTVIGLLGIVFNLLYVILVIAMQNDPEQRQKLPVEGVALNVILFLAGAALSVVVSLAGLRMSQLRQYAFAMTGSILATFASCACVCLGLPGGIWAIATLLRPEVRDAFQ